jgi:hypothetical protein
MTDVETGGIYLIAIAKVVDAALALAIPNKMPSHGSSR